MLGKSRSVGERIAVIVFAVIAVTVVVVALTALGSVAGLWAWPPQPSSGLGIACGLLAGMIVLFEMLILPRKWLRGRRLGSARRWMWWHVWLGLVSLPIVLVHAGFGLGGPLPAATLVLFLLVFASGVWGLVMQQWLPGKLLAEVPGETVASQIDFMGEQHATEADRIVRGLLAGLAGMSPAAAELIAFRDGLLLPYLLGARSPLASRAEAGRRFTGLQDSLPEPAGPAIDRLRELAEARRQWDRQALLNFWLHNWLLVHLPLSVAMTGLMLLHAVRALKYW